MGLRGLVKFGKGVIMKIGKNANAIKWLLDIIIILFGTAIFAIGVHSFTAPSKIAPGGVTGISTVINYLTNIPIGVVVAAINVPIIILGFFFLGRKLIIKTIISTIAFSILVDYGFKYVPVYQGDLMIASLFGGAFIGIGLGIVYTREGTTGGMDIINRLIQKKVPHVKLGRITLATDVVVIAVATLAFKDINAALYAVIAMYVSTHMMDVLMYGMNERKLMLIVTQRPHPISERIIKMNRGVTIMKAQGAYSGMDNNVILCAVAKNQYYRVRRIVTEIDPKAFIIITSAAEVLGEGFVPLS